MTYLILLIETLQRESQQSCCPHLVEEEDEDQWKPAWSQYINIDGRERFTNGTSWWKLEALRTAALRQHDANDGLTRWDLAETYDNDDNDALLAWTCSHCHRTVFLNTDAVEDVVFATIGRIQVGLGLHLLQREKCWASSLWYGYDHNYLGHQWASQVICWTIMVTQFMETKSNVHMPAMLQSRPPQACGLCTWPGRPLEAMLLKCLWL